MQDSPCAKAEGERRGGAKGWRSVLTAGARTPSAPCPSGERLAATGCAPRPCVIGAAPSFRAPWSRGRPALSNGKSFIHVDELASDPGGRIGGRGGRFHHAGPLSAGLRRDLVLHDPPAAGADEGSSRQGGIGQAARSEEHTSELQSLMRISYAV